MIFLDVLTIVSIGLLIGTELSVSVFVNPILERLDAHTRMLVTSYFGKRLGAAMPPWYIFSALLLIAETAIRYHSNGKLLLITASAFWLIAIAISVAVLVPLNKRIVQLDSGSAQSSFAEHRTWDVIHRGRVAVLAISMICFLLAVLQ